MKNGNCDRRFGCLDFAQDNCDGCGANKPQGDLISREALKEATKSFTDCDGFNPVWQIIDNAPTVEIDEGVIQKVLNSRCMTAVSNEYLMALHGQGERPHGKWEEDWREDLDFMSRKGWKCPFCKWRTTYGESNFCMNCGADLRKGGAE